MAGVGDAGDRRGRPHLHGDRRHRPRGRRARATVRGAGGGRGPAGRPGGRGGLCGDPALSLRRVAGLGRQDRRGHGRLCAAGPTRRAGRPRLGLRGLGHPAAAETRFARRGPEGGAGDRARSLDHACLSDPRHGAGVPRPNRGDGRAPPHAVAGDGKRARGGHRPRGHGPGTRLPARRADREVWRRGLCARLPGRAPNGREPHLRGRRRLFLPDFRSQRSGEAARALACAAGGAKLEGAGCGGPRRQLDRCACR